MILTIIVTIILLLLLLMTARLAYRRILKSRHAIPAPGIDQEELVKIGGIEQYLYFRGRNLNNPVILILHGGPGSPLSALLHGFQYGWESDFTLVHWDQRRSGKTYYANVGQEAAKTLSFDLVMNDAWEVTQYIKNKLNQDKLIIMGHSWGTILGTALVQTHPEAFSGYIGVGQVTNLIDNEQMGYDTVMQKALDAKDHKDMKILESLLPYPENIFTDSLVEKIKILRKYQGKYGLASTMDLSNLVLGATSPYYNLKEELYYFKDILTIQKELLRYMYEQYNIHHFGTSYKVPVYYIMGENDYQTPVPLAKKFFTEIKADQKTFYLVPDAGHFTMTDNNKEFTRILLEEIRPRY